jgi:hypothetical protein
MCSTWGRMASCSGLLTRFGFLVGQGRALPSSWASRFQVRSKPRLLRRFRQQDQKTAGRAWPCPTRGPVPEAGKLNNVGITSCSLRRLSMGAQVKRSLLCIR